MLASYLWLVVKQICEMQFYLFLFHILLREHDFADNLTCLSDHLLVSLSENGSTLFPQNLSVLPLTHVWMHRASDWFSDLLQCKKPLTNIPNIFNSQDIFIFETVSFPHCLLLLIRVIFVFEPEWNLILLTVCSLVHFQTSSPLFHATDSCDHKQTCGC